MPAAFASFFFVFATRLVVLFLHSIDFSQIAFLRHLAMSKKVWIVLEHIFDETAKTDRPSHPCG